MYPDLTHAVAFERTGDDIYRAAMHRRSRQARAASESATPEPARRTVRVPWLRRRSSRPARA